MITAIKVPLLIFPDLSLHRMPKDNSFWNGLIAQAATAADLFSCVRYILTLNILKGIWM